MELQAGLYKHYKGFLYQVLSVARHSETCEPLVVYQALYGSYGVWVRPLEMFLDTLEHDGKKVKRFTYMGPSSMKLAALD